MGRRIVASIVVTSVAAAACHFQRGLAASDGGGADADADADAPGDALADSPSDAGMTCMERWAAHTVRFVTPALMSNVSGSSTDRDPFLSDDERTIYFSSDRGSSTSYLYQATRPAIGSAFGAPTKVTEIDVGGGCGKFSTTMDGLYAVFASARAAGVGGGVDVWETSRASTGSAWDVPTQTNLTAVDTVDPEQDAEIDHDGLRLYLARNPGGGPQEIEIAYRAMAGSAFGSATRINELYSGVGDADPSVSDDLTVMVFSSNRTGTGSAGGNIWYSTRADPNQTWGTPLPVPDVNSDGGDGDPHLGSDGCRLYFASDRNGDYDLFVTHMQ